MFVVWIDAAHGAGERIFGLTLLERHLKALKHRKVQPGEVVIDLGSGETPEPPEAGRRWPFPVRVVRNGGTIAQRLGKSAVGRRDKGVASGMAIGFGLGFLYFISEGLVQSLGESGAVPPFFAAWLPALLFASIGGLWLIRLEGF